MIPLPVTGEVKLIALLVAVVGLLGFGVWTGCHYTAQHYQLIIAKDKAASDKVVSDKQDEIIRLDTERAIKLGKEAQDHEKRVADDTAAREQLDQRLHNLGGALRTLAMSTAVAVALGGSGAGSVPCGPGGIPASSPAIDAARAGVTAAQSGVDEALAGWNTASDKLIAAGQHDAREVTGILQVAPNPETESKDRRAR
jgi:hypothetical protein